MGKSFRFNRQYRCNADHRNRMQRKLESQEDRNLGVYPFGPPSQRLAPIPAALAIISI